MAMSNRVQKLMTASSKTCFCPSCDETGSQPIGETIEPTTTPLPPHLSCFFCGDFAIRARKSRVHPDTVQIRLCTSCYGAEAAECHNCSWENGEKCEHGFMSRPVYWLYRYAGRPVYLLKD